MSAEKRRKRCNHHLLRMGKYLSRTFLIISKGKLIWLVCCLEVDYFLIRRVSSAQKLEVTVKFRYRERMSDTNSVIELIKDYCPPENRN